MVHYVFLFVATFACCIQRAQEPQGHFLGNGRFSSETMDYYGMGRHTCLQVERPDLRDLVTSYAEKLLSGASIPQDLLDDTFVPLTLHFSKAIPESLKASSQQDVKKRGVFDDLKVLNIFYPEHISIASDDICYNRLNEDTQEISNRLQQLLSLNKRPPYLSLERVLAPLVQVSKDGKNLIVHEKFIELDLLTRRFLLARSLYQLTLPCFMIDERFSYQDEKHILSARVYDGIKSFFNDLQNLENLHPESAQALKERSDNYFADAFLETIDSQDVKDALFPYLDTRDLVADIGWVGLVPIKESRLYLSAALSAGDMLISPALSFPVLDDQGILATINRRQDYEKRRENLRDALLALSPLS